MVVPGFWLNITKRMAIDMKIPSTKATKAMPQAMRTACMSLVARAIRSPTVLCWKYAVGKSMRCEKNLSRRDFSMRRDAPCMKKRQANLPAATKAATATIHRTNARTECWAFPMDTASMDLRIYWGIRSCAESTAKRHRIPTQ